MSERRNYQIDQIAFLYFFRFRFSNRNVSARIIEDSEPVIDSCDTENASDD